MQKLYELSLCDVSEANGCRGSGCVWEAGQPVRVECLGDGKDTAQSRVGGGAGVRFPAFKFSVGEAREARVGCHLVLGISFGDAYSGDVDAEFPGIVFPAESALSISMQISCHVLHGHVCMTY